MKLLITGASTLLGSQVLSWFKQNYPEMQISTLDDEFRCPYSSCCC
jgi:hypothetical protein